MGSVVTPVNTFRGVGTGGGSSGATSGTFTLPTAVNRPPGAIIFAVCAVKNLDTHTWSGTGWTEIGEWNNGSGLTVSLAYADASASPGNATCTWTNSAAWYGYTFSYGTNESLFDFASPVGTVNASSGTGTTHTSNSITAVRKYSRAIYVGVCAVNSAFATPSGWAENNDGGSTGGAMRIAIGSKSLTNVGDTSGNISITAGNAAWIQLQFELKFKEMDATDPVRATQVRRSVLSAADVATPSVRVSAFALEVLSSNDDNPPAPSSGRRVVVMMS
jgi:hypothetical protein